VTLFEIDNYDQRHYHPGYGAISFWRRYGVPVTATPGSGGHWRDVYRYTGEFVFYTVVLLLLI